MTKFTLDKDLRAKLNGLTEPLELTDESGQTIGHFLPPDRYQNFLYRLAEAQSPFTRDQLQQLRQEEGGVALSEFWQRLGNA